MNDDDPKSFRMFFPWIPQRLIRHSLSLQMLAKNLVLIWSCFSCVLGFSNKVKTLLSILERGLTSSEKTFESVSLSAATASFSYKSRSLEVLASLLMHAISSTYDWRRRSGFFAVSLQSRRRCWPLFPFILLTSAYCIQDLLLPLLYQEISRSKSTHFRRDFFCFLMIS